MNKTAIKNFAIWARNKLIADIQYRAGLMGITKDGIKDPLPQSTATVEFYDIGTPTPYSITGEAIPQRKKLAEIIRRKEKDSDYPTAYKYILEEVAYTWFNRLIAIRFMEVNDYLPSHIRVLSSESGKIEPDLVTTPFDAGLTFTAAEEETVLRLKTENKLDELFRLLFIKQCNALNAILPALFETTSDYTELLLNLSVVDQEGVVYRLVHDISEDDFNIEQGGQVEIIGWLYQYYNTELNEQVYDGNMSKSRIPKELLPAATTIYTPDWAVRYMVENSLGRIFIESQLAAAGGQYSEAERAAKEKELANQMGWRYYLPEAEQTPEVRVQLDKLTAGPSSLDALKLIDPCMGSGHILVYAFDVLIQMYEKEGYSQRDAAQCILQNNLFGLDIDKRAAQLAYFAVMMKARQYDRRFLTRGIQPHVYPIIESNAIGGSYKLAMGDFLLSKEHQDTLNYLLDAFLDAKEYGAILQLENRDYVGLMEAWKYTASQTTGNINLTLWYSAVEEAVPELIRQAIVLSQKYDVVVTNPPYLGSARFSPILDNYIKENYANVKSDLSMVMYKSAISNFSKPNGYIAFITTSSWMFLSSFEKLRNFLNSAATLYNLVDFGTELFDGKVGHNPIVSWVTRKLHADYRMTAIRLVDYCYSRRDEKEPEFFNPKNRYTAQQANFAKIPGAPVAYWVSDNLISIFNNPKIGDLSYPKQGLSSADNNRFLRLWFEIAFTNFDDSCVSNQESAKSGVKWFPFNKGGEYRKWHGNFDYVINWENDGFELRNFPNAAIRNPEYYFFPHVTWSKVTSGTIAFRYRPVGSVFSDAGCAAIFSDDIVWYALGLLNTKYAQKVFNLINPTLNYTQSTIAALPIIVENKTQVDQLVRTSMVLSQTDWDSYETSWDFKRHPMV